MSKALREAFYKGAMWGRAHRLHLYPFSDAYASAHAEAKAVYPPKTETRPREVVVTLGLLVQHPVTYRIKDGVIEQKQKHDGSWLPSANFVLEGLRLSVLPRAARPSEIAKIFDLIGNPNETVEVE